MFPWRWFLCKPKHVGAFLSNLECFNNSAVFLTLCASVGNKRGFKMENICSCPFPHYYVFFFSCPVYSPSSYNFFSFSFLRLLLHLLLYFLSVLSSVIVLSITYYFSFSVPIFFSYITIIIISHQLGLNRPVSASSNSPFKDLPSRRRIFCP